MMKAINISSSTLPTSVVEAVDVTKKEDFMGTEEFSANDFELKIGMAKKQEYGVDIKYDPLAHEMDVMVKREVEEQEEWVGDTDIKCEPLDCGERPAIPKAEKQLQCYKCDFKTKYRSSLKWHNIRIHEKETAPQYSCDSCLYQTICMHDLSKHILHVHKKSLKQFECDRCSYKSTVKRNVIRHIMLVHEKEKASGASSYQTIIESDQSKDDMHTYTENELQFKCDKCDYTAKVRYNLKRHIMLVHKKKKASRYACDLCSYETINKSNLCSHIRSMHQKLVKQDRPTCELCQKSFGRKQQLDVHYVKAHPDQSDSFKHLLTGKVNECQICGYKCLWNSVLKRHMRLHSDHLPFVCTECNKRFNTKMQLHGHIVAQHRENEQLMETVTSKVHQCSKCSMKTVHFGFFKRHKEICKN